MNAVVLHSYGVRTSSNFGPIRLRTVELAALERLKKIPIDLLW